MTTAIAAAPRELSWPALPWGTLVVVACVPEAPVLVDWAPVPEAGTEPVGLEPLMVELGLPKGGGTAAELKIVLGPDDEEPLLLTALLVATEALLEAEAETESVPVVKTGAGPELLAMGRTTVLEGWAEAAEEEPAALGHERS